MGFGLDVDFNNLKETSVGFPSTNVVERNAYYGSRKKLLDGNYNEGVALRVLTDNGKKERTLPYKVLTTNYFELVLNKLDSIMFSNEIMVSVGDVYKDKQIRELVERTGWAADIRKAVLTACTYGDCVVRVNRNGINSLTPINCYKVINEHDKDDVLGYVIYENLGVEVNFNYVITHVRVEIHDKHGIYERVYEYVGSSNNIIPVEYEYRGRVIPEEGEYWETGVDESTVSWLSVGDDGTGVYGKSIFDNLTDLVFALEQLETTKNYVARSDANPALICGMSFCTTNEETGEYMIEYIDGNIIPTDETEKDPRYLTKSDCISNLKSVSDDLLAHIYVLSEMGKPYLTGEYGGNISFETLDGVFRSVIDRADRIINSMWNSMRKSLYVLTRLNGIDINIEDLNIEFVVGRTVSPEDRYDLYNKATSSGAVSERSARISILGMTDEQADEEYKQIKVEGG